MIQGYDPRTGKPAGEAMGPAGRAAALRAVADALDAQASELAAVADTETALGSTRLTGEVARTTGQLRMFADVLADGSYLDLIPSPPAQGVPGLRRMVRPLGPVAVFSASNFPFAFSVAGGDTASALAAGCPVVVEAHEGHPLTSRLTTEVLLDAARTTHMPDGVISMLHGVDPEVSLAVVRHPALTAVGFTGSSRAGRALFDAAAARPTPIPVYAEMGSINP